MTSLSHQAQQFSRLHSQAPSRENLFQRMQKVSIEAGPGLKDVQNFTNQLAVMIRAGIDIRGAVESIAEQTEKQKFRQVLQRIKLNVESGRSFSQALAEHPKVFSPLYINMVRASEMSGSFADMLQRISDYLDRQMETRRMVIGAMVYPCIIGVMAIVTVVFMLTFVLPKFTTLFQGKEDLLPKPTKILIAISDAMRSYWYLILAVIGAISVGFKVSINLPEGRKLWDAFKLKIPLFKRMLRALYVSRSVHTMGELIAAGVPMLETLKITAEISGNTVYKRMWMSVHSAVQQGEKIVKPLSTQDAIPKSVVRMIAAGEESGSLAQVLRNVSDYYTKELKSTIKTVTSMMEPLMIVLMGVIVGFIAMSIILPIFKMSSLAK